MLNRIGRATGVLALVVLVVWPALAHASQADEVHATTLSNGMKVILWEDDTIPNLALYIFWKVGSRNEAPGITGLAHFFEHMMFNGSDEYPPGEFDRTMEAAGGANNAYTSNDVTVYQDWIPASALDITLDLEADRIANLSVDPEMVESERGVVMSERQSRVDDDNQGLMWEHLYAAAFQAHPYSWPVIGWASDIENWRQEDGEAFFEKWYAPNNAVLVLVGAFEQDEALAKLEDKLGSIPARELDRGVTTVEPPQRGQRRIDLRKEANLGSVLVAWHVPDSSHEDTRVIEVMQRILSDGDSSRLTRRLVDQEELALWVWAGGNRNFDPGLFEILIQNRKDVSSARVEEVLYEELGRLAHEPVSDEELQKAKNLLLADFYRNMATISGRAHSLGAYELFHGGWANLFEIEQTYASVTAADIQRVVNEYFIEDNRTVVTLVPKTDAPEVDTDAR